MGAALLPTTSFGAESTWPQWRGPNRDGQFTGPSWPEKLDTNHLHRTWSVELGPSYSGPIVVDDRVITTESKGKKFEVVTALDRKTGKERWRFDFVKKLEAPLPDFGFVCSPLVEGDFVYVQAGASFVKLDKRTGELVWRTLPDKGGMYGSVFSSPTFADLAGKRQLVVQTREKLAGVDPADGKVLWEQPVEAFRGMNILTPAAYKDTLFSSTYGGKTIGFKVAQADGKFTVTEAWKHKAQGYMSTPVVIGGIAYNHLKSQRVMAIEVESGRELWTSELSFGKYMSLVAQGDRILALDQRGLLFLFRANQKKFDQLDQRKLTEAETWAHLAIAGDELFVRELNALTAFRWSHPGPTDTTAARQ